MVQLGLLVVFEEQMCHRRNGDGPTALIQSP